MVFQDPKVSCQHSLPEFGKQVQAVADALLSFHGSTTALQALEDHLDDRNVLLRLCQNVGKHQVLQTMPESTVHSLSEAFILGRQHQSRGEPVFEAASRKEALTARIISNPHLKAYLAGYLSWPRNRVNTDELQQMCALANTEVPREHCAAAIRALDSMPWLTRLPAIHSVDLERLCSLAISQTDRKLQQCARESVAEELQLLGVSKSPQRAKNAHREERTRDATAFATAQHTQCNLCLAKILSWARDQGAVALCKSNDSQQAHCARVRLIVDTSDLIQACITDKFNHTWMRVDVAVNVPIPSPTVAFAALKSGPTCSVLQCMLALHTAGIGLQLWEMVLLTSRYAAPHSYPSYSWAARIRWPALLRDLGVAPDSHIPAGRTASLIEVADMLASSPADGTLSDAQQWQVQQQVASWEESARRSLEAVCGHTVRAASLLPYLKFAPSRGSRTPACGAAGEHSRLGSDDPSEGAVTEHSCSEGGSKSRPDPTESEGQQVPSSFFAEKDGTDAVQMSRAVRVLLVAQEPVGRLAPCVHVHLEASQAQREDDRAPVSADLHPVFDMPILYTWASQQLHHFKALQRMFCAADPQATGMCSVQDAQYVFSVVYGRFPSDLERRTLLKAFRGAALKDVASRVAGTHERFRYKAFLAAISPCLVLLLHEKSSTPVLPRDDASCPLYVMCVVSAKTIPGVGALHRAFMEPGSGCRRMGRPLMEFADFKMIATAELSGNQEHVDELLKACRSVGSKGVAVDVVEWLLCIRLERCLAQIQTGQ